MTIDVVHNVSPTQPVVSRSKRTNVIVALRFKWSTGTTRVADSGEVGGAGDADSL